MTQPPSPQPSGPPAAPPAGSGLWTRWRGYLARWLAFGLAIHVLMPVPDDAQPWWQHKLLQAAVGLLFGLLCTLLFTPAENAWNTPRVRWKSVALVAATWLLVKVSMVSVLALLA